ncbi:hypothetical protein E3N88_32308 [Mikania micrantha]|uniref:Uncharacterized protein n=1 Tax=Mikania micrantha TaxID=192012 RepID=A0A5N6M830_9ASTR|nr:hypothetical protein E3N88_32308 [Mikania micrantha]
MNFRVLGKALRMSGGDHIHYVTVVGPEFQSWVFLCAFFASSPSLFVFASDSSGILLICVNWLLSFIINSGAFTDGIDLDITGILQIAQSVVASGEMMSLGNVVATDATSRLLGNGFELPNCAKKLPLATHVLVLLDGKGIFKRFSNGQL